MLQETTSIKTFSRLCWMEEDRTGKKWHFYIIYTHPCKDLSTCMKLHSNLLALAVTHLVLEHGYAVHADVLLYEI